MYKMSNIAEKAMSRTPDEQKEFLTEIIRLSLYFAAEYQSRHPQETLYDIIIKRTAMWEILGIQRSVHEPAFTSELEKLYGRTAPSSEFEEEGFKLLKPYMEQFIRGNTDWEKNDLARYNGSCFRYDNPTETADRNHCSFHITNSISPGSILEDEGYTSGCFIKLMDDSQKEFGCDVLRTKTWLNSLPQWLKFFPQEWQDNLSEPDENILGNLGYWGQVITARKTFACRRGAYIREHLELQYKPRSSWCTFKAMREHLKQFFY